MRSDTFNFEVPAELIAQTPPARRGESRLLVVRRNSGALEHRKFSDLPDLLRPDDLLVLNDTRVKPCRLHCTRQDTGGHVELFLLRPLADREYEALSGSWRNLREGERLVLPEEGGLVELVEKGFSGGPGHWRVRFERDDAEEFIARAARMPLPPYIKRERTGDPHAALDRDRYQTIYARAEGAVAAPTAGLHFTRETLAQLQARGIGRATLTLHVGPGTFRPLKAETLEQHNMHAEAFEIPDALAGTIRAARSRGGRIVVVGTTACRALETMADDSGGLRTGRGETALFIYPPWRFRLTDALLTNFHLPHSTLIFLVAALIGVELTRRAYLEAITRRYRFFSYGDAMLILP